MVFSGLVSVMKIWLYHNFNFKGWHKHLLLWESGNFRVEKTGLHCQFICTVAWQYIYSLGLIWLHPNCPSYHSHRIVRRSRLLTANCYLYVTCSWMVAEALLGWAISSHFVSVHINTFFPVYPMTHKRILNLKKISFHIWNLEKWWRWTYLQEGRSREPAVENGLVGPGWWGEGRVGRTERAARTRMHCRCLSVSKLFPTLCDTTDCSVAHWAPLSMEFSRQEYWSGLPFPPPKDLPGPGMDTLHPDTI